MSCVTCRYRSPHGDLLDVELEIRTDMQQLQNALGRSELAGGGNLARWKVKPPHWRMRNVACAHKWLLIAGTVNHKLFVASNVEYDRFQVLRRPANVENTSHAASLSLVCGRGFKHIRTCTKSQRATQSRPSCCPAADGCIHRRAQTQRFHFEPRIMLRVCAVECVDLRCAATCTLLSSAIPCTVRKQGRVIIACHFACRNCYKSGRLRASRLRKFVSTQSDSRYHVPQVT